ncbi:MAG: hypothetical protein JW809_19490 [Pirellulales bacterium]|nr:hypothetical protein [Pirellulales bacterium]
MSIQSQEELIERLLLACQVGSDADKARDAVKAGQAILPGDLAGKVVADLERRSVWLHGAASALATFIDLPTGDPWLDEVLLGLRRSGEPFLEAMELARNHPVLRDRVRRTLCRVRAARN